MKRSVLPSHYACITVRMSWRQSPVLPVLSRAQSIISRLAISTMTSSKCAREVRSSNIASRQKAADVVAHVEPLRVVPRDYISADETPQQSECTSSSAGLTSL
jgi:hypothetical protein